MAVTGSLRHPLVVRFLAEFAVIVLGVLTALAADGWVSARADRSLEREYLERLRDEIVAHLEEVEQTSRLNLWGFAGAERLLAGQVRRLL